jgi:WD40 repeat protein/energy-coupling factor transporter ATP-binding protein EcfA2
MAPRNFHANPFPGIRSYEINENHHFFGRELQVLELIRKLSETRFLAIVGSSGCGKSSLIKAGLIPELFKKRQDNLPESWKLLIFRPAEDPIGNLGKALSDGLHEFEQIDATLRSGNNGLVKVLRETLSPNQAGLLYIDQFEELFRFKRNGSISQTITEATLFIDLIINAIIQSEIPLYIVLSMRTDFLDECTEFRGLSEMINKGYYLVPRMNSEERRLAITGPISTTGNSISESLVERLLEDVGDDPDQLPILQHAMMRTWDHWTMNKIGNQPIDIEHYEAIGTMKEALSVHLEEIYSDLKDEKNKYDAEKLFKALTDLTKESRGTRRPTTLGEICTLTNAKEEEITRVIDQFRSPGCAFLMPSANITLTKESTIDISHESIMRVWLRLKKWVEEEGESAQLYLRLSKSAELYQEGKTGLWVNPELQLALQWKEQTRPNVTWATRYDPAFDRAMTFLNYSKKQHELELSKKENQQKRNLKRARNSAVILGIASIISILFLIVSLNLRFKAEASRKEALEKEKMAVVERKKTDEQRKEAIIQRKISEQQQQIAEQQEMITEQQRQYAVKQQMIAQEQTVEAIQQKKHADDARHEAITARDEAQLQRKEAITQKQIADLERINAEESERTAQRLRLLAISNSMAIQALQLHSTVSDETPALYALTAYQLNNENGGSETDPAIYSALSAISNDPIVLRGHDDAVRAITISTNGKFLFSCGDDKNVLRWNLTNYEEPPLQAEIPKEIKEPIRSIMLTRDDKWLVAGTTTGQLIVWSQNLFPKSAKILEAHTSIVSSLTADPVMDQFYSCGSDGLLLKWNYDGLNFYRTLLDSVADPIGCSDINITGKQMVYATAAGDVKVISLYEKQLTASFLMKLKSPALSVKYDNNGETIAIGCQDGSVQLLQKGKSGELQQQEVIGRHISGITGLAFSPDGGTITSAGYDWKIRMSFYPLTEEKPVTINNHELWVYDVLFTPDGSQLISCSADKTIRIFSTQNQQMADKLTPAIKRNMTITEWNKMVGLDVPFHKTIKNLP